MIYEQVFKVLIQVPSPSTKFYLYKKVSKVFMVETDDTTGELLYHKELAEYFDIGPRKEFVITVKDKGTHIASRSGVKRWVKSIKRERGEQAPKHGSDIWDTAEVYLSEWIRNGYK